MPTAPEDRFTTVNGIKARHWQAGDGGSAVMLIHGLGGAVENWVHNLHALGREHRVFALDLVGFGRSDKPRGDYGLATLARFVRDFMDDQKIATAALVGNSLGGAVSLTFARSWPERVSALVLVCSAGLGRGATMVLRAASVPLLGELLRASPSRAMTRWFMRRTVADPALVTDDAVETFFAHSSAPGASAAFLAALRAQCTLFGQRRSVTGPIVESLPRLRAPTLVVWGRQDRIVPAAHAEVARAIPGAEVEIYDPCGHLPMYERPDEFNRRVAGFLARAPGAESPPRAAR
jgi:pimeloyl-ACP methyl ester carboxylesterase